jgi:hypothetical protein
MLRRSGPIIAHNYTERHPEPPKSKKAQIPIDNSFEFSNLLSLSGVGGSTLRRARSSRSTFLIENAGSYCALIVAERLAIGFRNQMPKAVVSTRQSSSAGVIIG